MAVCVLGRGRREERARSASCGRRGGEGARRQRFRRRTVSRARARTSSSVLGCASTAARASTHYSGFILSPLFGFGRARRARFRGTCSRFLLSLSLLLSPVARVRVVSVGLLRLMRGVDGCVVVYVWMPCVRLRGANVERDGRPLSGAARGARAPPSGGERAAATGRRSNDCTRGVEGGDRGPLSLPPDF